MKTKKNLSVLVLTNYLWRRKYNWHLDHLGTIDTDCRVDFENIANYVGNLKKLLAYMKIFSKVRQADCVVVDGYVSLAFYILLPVIKRKDARIVMASQNYDFGSVGIKNKLKIILLTWMYDCSATIVVPSNITADIFKLKFPKRIHQKIAVLHSAINFEAINDFLEYNPESNGIPLAAGVSMRDYACLSKAIKKLPQFNFHVNTRPGLYNLYFKQFENVCLIQHSETATLLEQIRVAEFVVIPLPKDKGTSGLRILFFALELGKPIIVAKTDAIIEYFEDNKPFLTYKPGDARELLAQIVLLKSDEGLRRQLSINARKFAETKLLSSEHFRIFWETFVQGERCESQTFEY